MEEKKRTFEEVSPSTATTTTGEEKEPKKKAKKEKEKATKGNYHSYYGYRELSGQLDPRLEFFRTSWITKRDCLDVGCNAGALTIAVAERFHPRSIVGIDIDPELISQARAALSRRRGKIARQCVRFEVSDITTMTKEGEEPPGATYDTVLCMSVTKWVHLNTGDDGLMRMFKGIHSMLREGGVLVLEPQPWKGYRRRSNMTPEMKKNFSEAKIRPNDFSRILIEQVGFTEKIDVHIPEHGKGFDRPIFAFIKRSSSNPPPVAAPQPK